MFAVVMTVAAASAIVALVSWLVWLERGTQRMLAEHRERMGLPPRAGFWARAGEAWRTRGQVTQGPRFSEDPDYAREREREAA